MRYYLGTYPRVDNAASLGTRSVVQQSLIQHEILPARNITQELLHDIPSCQSIIKFTQTNTFSKELAENLEMLTDGQREAE